MTKRKSISKKVRFDIFKRDSFQCQYCGNTPPSVILEIDHINPVSKGGENDIDNLLTACFDCNRGKAAETLDVIPDTLVEKAEVAKEREQQLKDFNKLKTQIKARKTKQANKVSSVFTNYFKDRELTRQSIGSIKNQFLPKLDVITLVENMELACERNNDPSIAFRYFCGICWNMIKDKDNA